MHVQSFSPEWRLRKPEEFKKLWRAGRRCSVQLISLNACLNPLTHARLGVVVSKRNVPRAVDRNRIKRLARETFRARQHMLARCDIVVVAYKGIDKLPLRVQYTRFNQLWDVYLTPKP